MGYRPNIEISTKDTYIEDSRGYRNIIFLTDSIVPNGYKTYSTLDEVEADFDTDNEVYLGARDFFGQALISVGRVGSFIAYEKKNSTQGKALSSVLNLGTFTSISDGSLNISIDAGADQSITGLDLTSITSLNELASLLDNNITGGTIEFEQGMLIFTSDAFGTSSIILLKDGLGGTNLLPLFGVITYINGKNSKTLEENFADIKEVKFPSVWLILSNNMVGLSSTSELISFAENINASTDFFMLCFNYSNSDVLAEASTTDLFYLLSNLKSLSNVFVSYTEDITESPVLCIVAYLCSSIFGSMSANNRILTNISVPELTKNQIGSIATKNGNVIDRFQSGINIQGRLCNGQQINRTLMKAYFEIESKIVVAVLLKNNAMLPFNSTGTSMLLGSLNTNVFTPAIASINALTTATAQITLKVEIQDGKEYNTMETVITYVYSGNTDTIVLNFFITDE